MRSKYSPLITGVAAALVVLGGIRPSHGQEAKGIATAKKIVTTFWSKVEARKDVDAVLTMVDVPFC